MSDIFARALASLGAGKLQADEEKRQANLQAQANDRANAASSLAQQEGQQNLQIGQQKLQMGPLDRAKQLMDLNQQGVSLMAPNAPTATDTMGRIANAAGYQPSQTDLGDVGDGQHAYMAPSGGIAAKISKALASGDPSDIGAVLGTPGFSHLGSVLTKPEKGPDQNAIRDAENQREYGTFQQLNPQHPLSQMPYNPQVDYGKLTAGLQTRATLESQQGDRAQARREHEDFMRQMAAAKPNPAREAAQAADTMSEAPAAQIAGYQAPGAFKQWAAAHVPVVGNAIAGTDYQQLHQAAIQLATQFVSTIPRLRPTPQIINMMANQIAPIAGDSPATVAQKKATVDKWRTLIHQRATAGPQGTPDVHDLNDAPVP